MNQTNYTFAVDYDMTNDEAEVKIYKKDSDKIAAVVKMTNAERLIYSIERHDETLTPNELFVLMQRANDEIVALLDDPLDDEAA
jgi:hypothetical protein